MNEKTVQESKATEMSDIEKQVARAREVAKRRSEEPPVEVGDSYENPNFKLALQHLPRGYRLGLSTNPAAYGDPKQDPKTIRPDQLPTHTLYMGDKDSGPEVHLALIDEGAEPMVRKDKAEQLKFKGNPLYMRPFKITAEQRKFNADLTNKRIKQAEASAKVKDGLTDMRDMEKKGS